MDTTKNLALGQVVKSKAGRDTGNIYFVYQIVDETKVALVDGDSRGFDNPKIKNVKHLMKYNSMIEIDLGLYGKDKKLNNALVKKQLDAFRD